MKRIFDATPRFMVYFVSALALLLLSMPYWLDWFPTQTEKTSFFLADEVPESVPPPVQITARVVVPTQARSDSPLSHFGEIRLEATRDEMKRTFDLHSLSVYGADPEIYESSTINEVDHFTGCFSGGLLKEAFVIQHEKPTSAAALQKDLVQQFGQPTEQTDSTGATATPALLNLDTAKDWIPSIAALPFHRSLVWSDANFRIEATIHYSSADPAQSRSIMAVHMRATTSRLNQTLSQYTAHTLAVRPAVD